MSYRSVVVALLAVVTSGAAVTFAHHSTTELPSVSRSAQQVPPTAAALVCPPAQTGGKSRTSVFAVSPSSELSRGSAGALQLAPLRTATPPVTGRITSAGHPLRRSLKAANGADWSVSAAGGLAPGVSAAESSVLSSRRTSGLAMAACGSAANGWWFSAVDTSVGATSKLVLANPTPAVAVVDLALFGPRGRVQPLGARGLAIAARSSRSIELAALAPGADALTVNVRASRGSVAAAVLTTKLHGISPVGSDWISPSAAPSTDVVVNPAPRTAGQQRLVLTNTTTREALAHVRVFDVTGTFTPTQLEDVRIEPGAVVVKDLSPITNGGAAGVRVTANVAVAAALTTAEPGESADFTLSTSSAPITDPAVVPLFRGAELSLLLTTAKGAGGSVRVEGYDSAGEQVARHLVNLKGAATTVWETSNRSNAAYLVLGARASAGIQGVAYYRSTDGIASLPVISGVWSIQRPGVLPAP